MISLVLRGQKYFDSDEISAFERFDRLYGLDQNLVNGVRYIPAYPGAQGHPFLTEEAFQAGSLQVGENSFEKVMLAYDIHKQDVLLRYTHSTGIPVEIILRKKRINAFVLGLKTFEKLKLDETGLKFYQVLGTGGNKFCVYWSKSLSQSGTGNSFYVFSQPRRKFFLLKQGNALPFKSRGSFIKLFEPEQKRALKTYFRESQITLKTATDRQLEGLLNFCNDLPEKK
jgi:hypothetical protein